MKTKLVRVLALALILAIAISLTACGGNQAFKGKWTMAYFDANDQKYKDNKSKIEVNGNSGFILYGEDDSNKLPIEIEYKDDKMTIIAKQKWESEEEKAKAGKMIGTIIDGTLVIEMPNIPGLKQYFTQDLENFKYPDDIVNP